MSGNPKDYLFCPHHCHYEQKGFELLLDRKSLTHSWHFLHSYLDGATPTRLGPKPRNSERGPSFSKINLKTQKYNASVKAWNTQGKEFKLCGPQYIQSGMMAWKWQDFTVYNLKLHHAYRQQKFVLCHLKGLTELYVRFESFKERQRKRGRFFQNIQPKKRMFLLVLPSLLLEQNQCNMLDQFDTLCPKG